MILSNFNVGVPSIIERKGSVCPWSPLKLSSRISDFVTTVASVLSCQRLLINSLRRCSKIFIHFLLSWLEEKMLRSRNMLEFLWERFRKLRLVATRIFIARYFLKECLILISLQNFVIQNVCHWWHWVYKFVARKVQQSTGNRSLININFRNSVLKLGSSSEQ